MQKTQPPSRRLVILKISPWSERARWALDHHGLAYQTIEHAPFLGERRLRRLVGSRNERATVPVLLAEGQTLTESWDIALHADREGSGTKLIPEEHADEVRRWNTLADQAMAAGRALVVAAMLESPAALDESVPRGVPSFLRPALRPMGRYGMKWFGRKYGVHLADLPLHLAKMKAALQTHREALAKRSPYLLGSFSYADIVMASTLQGVSPVDNRYIQLGPALRRAWTREELAAEYSDLVAWRDRLYAQHRSRMPG